MTIIVGIRCTNGVVIGTDSAMTFGPNQQTPTIEQPFPAKIDIINEQYILAGSGQIGLGQRFAHHVSTLHSGNKLKEGSVIEKATRIVNKAVVDFSSTGAPKEQYGALFAMPHGRDAELVEFATKDLQPEVKSNQNWYASMGSGQLIADPLLGFVRVALWGNDPPNRQEGVFAAYLVLHLVCEMAPFGIAPPIQMAVLQPDPKCRGQLKARLLSDDELQEHKESTDGALEHFKRFREKTGGVDAPTREPPPAPAAA